jgi:hypothetical protein
VTGGAVPRRLLPDAEIHLLDGGPFLLGSALDEVVPLVRVSSANTLHNSLCTCDCV